MNSLNKQTSDSWNSSATSGLTHTFPSSADMQRRHRLCSAGCTSGGFWPGTLVLVIFRINQSVSIRCFQPLTSVTEHKGGTSTAWIQNVSHCEGKHMQHPAQNLPHHTISLFLTFPLKSQEEYTATAETSTRRPSISQIKHTYQQSWGASRCLTHLSTFFRCFPPPPPPPFPDENKPERLKSPPEGGECRKEGEGTLIWACNTVQFAIGQWNSISFFPFGQYPSEESPQTLSSFRPQTLVFIFSSRWEGRVRLQQERLEKGRKHSRRSIFSGL